MQATYRMFLKFILILKDKNSEKTWGIIKRVKKIWASSGGRYDLQTAKLFDCF